MTNMWDESTGEVIDNGAANGASTGLAVTDGMIPGITKAPEGDSMLGMMVQAAQALQRDQAKLIARAKQIGGLLGTSGFYRFPAGGSTIEGPSIDMAQALAQDWGGIVYQVRIISAAPLAGGGQRVHLRASVGDLRALVCVEVDQVVSTSPPPGKFANKPDQVERWNAMQVQSAASKICRNALLRVLPAWYVEPAFIAAVDVDSRKALNGKTLEEARKGAAGALAELGCKQDELEHYLGDQPLDMWAVPQISTLRDLYADLKSGKTSIEAWRAALTVKTASGEPARRNTIGLPTAGSGKDEVAEAALKAEREKAAAAAAETIEKAKGKNSKGEQADLPGAAK